MSAAAVIAIAIGGIALGLAAGYWMPPHGRLPFRDRPQPVRRILLPFTGQAISRRAFEAAVRLAKAENAIIMPAFLARVPRNLPVDTPLPAQCAGGMPLLEAIEQRAVSQGVPVDSRVSPGRSFRDSLQRLLGQEQFDRIIISATENAHTGFSVDDLRWLLEGVPAEVMILRPAATDERRISAAEVSGHF
jgi:nucleotide-binding universal stress UspA family protein